MYGINISWSSDVSLLVSYFTRALTKMVKEMFPCICVAVYDQVHRQMCSAMTIVVSGDFTECIASAS